MRLVFRECSLSRNRRVVGRRTKHMLSRTACVMENIPANNRSTLTETNHALCLDFLDGWPSQHPSGTRVCDTRSARCSHTRTRAMLVDCYRAVTKTSCCNASFSCPGLHSTNATFVKGDTTTVSNWWSAMPTYMNHGLTVRCCCTRFHC